MSKAEFILLTSSENKVESIRQFVQTICIFNFTSITGRELDLLCEVIRCGGVNENAKKSFKINYKTTSENYGQLVKRLSDKGILVERERRNGRELHTIFFNLIELYINGEKERPLILKWKNS